MNELTVLNFFQNRLDFMVIACKFFVLIFLLNFLKLLINGRSFESGERVVLFFDLLVDPSLLHLVLEILYSFQFLLDLFFGFFKFILIHADFHLTII